MPDILVFYTGIMVFAQMFTIGLRGDLGDLLDLFREERLFWRSLFSVLVLVPISVFLIILLLRLPLEVSLGLVLLAAAPGAPLTARRSEAVVADVRFVSALQLTLAFVAVIFTPVAVFLFDRVFDVAPPTITPAVVATQVGLVTFVPVLLGWLLSRLAPGFSRRHEPLVSLVAKVLFVMFLLLVVLALVFVPELRDTLRIGWPGGLAVLLMAALAIAIGHALGGPRDDRRAGLAIATVARNLGLAIYIAELSPASVAAIPTILAYALVSSVLALPYAGWVKRRSEAEN